MQLYNYLVAACALFLLSNCDADSIDTEAVLRQVAQDRLDRIMRTRLRECEKDVLQAANLRADSLLMERARRLVRLADRPPKPHRPGAPPPRELSYDLPLRPLFPYEIRFDTLLRRQLLQDSLWRDSLIVAREIACADCLIFMQVDSLLPDQQIQDMYCLMQRAVADNCLEEEEDFRRYYAEHVYEALLRHPRMVELAWLAAKSEEEPASGYFDPLRILDRDTLLLDSLRLQMARELVEPATRQWLLEWGS